MSDEYEAVVKFNQEVLGIDERYHRLQEDDECALSINQLTEEITEFDLANEESNFIGAIDAMIDLQVFSMGVLYKLGITPSQYTAIFKAVTDANISKKKGVKAGREGYNAADAIKPKGWVPPEDAIFEILQRGK